MGIIASIKDSALSGDVYQINMTVEAGELNTDIDVYTPEGLEKVYLLGVDYSATSDHELIFKSVRTGTNPSTVEIFKTTAGLRGRDDVIGAGIVRFTEVGAKLTVRCNVAINNLVVWVTSNSGVAYRSF